MHNSRDKPSKNTPVEKIVSTVLCITLIVLMLGLLGTLFKPQKDGSNKVSSNTNNSMEDNTTEEDLPEIIFYEAQLITDISDLCAGDVIVLVAEDSDYAMSYDEESSFGYESVFKANSNIIAFSIYTDIMLLEVGIADNLFTFVSMDNKYLCCDSNGSNKLGIQAYADENSSWHVDIANNSAKITMSSNSSLGLNYSNGFKLHNFDAEPLESSGICIYRISSIIGS